MNYIGELAASGTAILWSISALLFTVAGKRVGPNTVNIARLAIGMVIIMAIHQVAFGSPFPFETEGWRWGVLALSAILGLVIGDTALFFAFVMIGPRLSMLIMSAVPVFSSLFAWLCFGQVIVGVEYLGMALTVGAIAWVVTEDRQLDADTTAESKEEISQAPEAEASHSDALIQSPNSFLLGIALALVGALGQTANLIVTKFALKDNDYSELSATEIRILVSLVALLGYFIIRGELAEMTRNLFKDAVAFAQTSVGALIGPVLGIWLSYIAIEYTKIGVASTIIALSPLLLIPLSAFYLDDRITVRTVIGTIVALIGVTVIFLI